MKNNKENKLFQRMYEENQVFIDKVVFITSICSIGVIVNSFEYFKRFNYGLNIIIGLFCSIVTLHMFGLIYARNGCENIIDIDDKKKEKGFKQCLIAKKLDCLRDILFIINIIAILFILLYDIKLSSSTIG